MKLSRRTVLKVLGLGATALGATGHGSKLLADVEQPNTYLPLLGSGSEARFVASGMGPVCEPPDQERLFNISVDAQ